MANQGGMGRGGGLVPLPDPTVLTTEALKEAIRQLDLRITTRLDAMDKAQALIHSDFTRVPTVVDRAAMNLQALLEEKIDAATSVTNERIKSLMDVTTQQFASINNTFSEKDKAVSVGLSAQKESASAMQLSNSESTAKMENNFTKLLDQNRELLQEVRKNTDLQINDLKSRLDRGEGVSRGGKEMWGYVAGAIGLVFGFVSTLVMILQHPPHL